MPRKMTCVIVDDEPMAREILTSYIDKISYLTLIKACKNAEEAIEYLHKNSTDIFLLDINMPGITGLNLAKIIDKKAKIIFTTAYRNYAVDGFNLDAVDYLLKPFPFERFLKAIDKVLVNEIVPKNDYFFVRSDRKMVKIDFDKIMYVESLSDYVKIYLEDKIVVTRETISKLHDFLPNQKFLRIHRSFIVSASKIESFNYESIDVKNKTLPISRSYKERVLQKLAKV